MPVIRFNPTATAIQYDGSNETEVRSILESATGTQYTGTLVQGTYYVAFMGKAYTMDDVAFRAAQGLV